MPRRTYSQLAHLATFEARFEYLMLGGTVGRETFGHERHLNQSFYRSREWRRVRDVVIARDEGCDLGIPGYEIHDMVVIHHMNPMIASDIIHADDDIINPEFLITVTHRTHNAIHYGDLTLLTPPLVVRTPGDTKLW